MTSKNNLIEWLIGCIPFADAPFDYLVILCTNGSGEINPSALRLSKRTLIDVKRTIASREHSVLAKLTPPYPVAVTEQMLSCFIAKSDFHVKNKTDTDMLPIGDIAEELWAYSTCVKLLTKPEDADYLSAELQSIQTNITGMLHILEGKLPPKDIDQLINTCEKVFEGNKFDDALFNNFIENFLQKNMK